MDKKRMVLHTTGHGTAAYEKNGKKPARPPIFSVDILIGFEVISK